MQSHPVDAPVIVNRLHRRRLWFARFLATESAWSAVGRVIRTIVLKPTICRKRLRKFLQQAWHGCNIPPGNEQICIFCHSTVENDGVAGSVGHIVKL